MHEQLPAELGRSFSVASARRLEVPASVIRSSALDRPFYGVRSLPADLLSSWRGVPLGAREAAHLERARAFASQGSSHEFFSHVTAAVLWGLPIPPHLLDSTDIHVGVLAPHRAPRGRGVRGRQVNATLAEVVFDAYSGMRVSSPAATWAMIAADLRHPYDVVAVGDAVIRSWRATALADLSALTAAAEAGRRIGVQRLRDALPRMRDRAASRPETWMRLSIVDAGLPEPEANLDVFVDGDYLACVDLGYPRLRVAMEYEGEHHLYDPVQWARDIERYERLTQAGWIVVRVTKGELFGQPGRMISRIRRAVAMRS